MRPLRRVVECHMLARASPFCHAADRRAVFRGLFTLLLRAYWHRHRTGRHPNKPVSHRLMGYTVAGPSYTILYELFREVFAEGTYRFDARTPAPRVIDGGAHVGMATLFFKHLYPTCQVVAFEPNPSAYALLRENVRRNRLRNVTLVAAALGERAGLLSFSPTAQLASLNATAYPISNTREQYSDPLTIKTTCLSEYLHEHRYDLVKLDVEGAETAVLTEVARAGLLQRADAYTIECHPRRGTDPAALRALLTDAGFVCRYKEIGAEMDEKGSAAAGGVKAAAGPTKSTERTTGSEEKTTEKGRGSGAGAPPDALPDGLLVARLPTDAKPRSELVITSR